MRHHHLTHAPLRLRHPVLATGPLARRRPPRQQQRVAVMAGRMLGYSLVLAAVLVSIVGNLLLLAPGV